MTRAGISKSRTPTGASAAGRSRSAIICTRSKEPDIVPADFADASVDVIGPSGNISAVLFCEKEGFGPLFKAVNLANRYDLMIVSTKGVSVTAARRLIDTVCGDHDLPLFVLHDFDVAGFLILGTLAARHPALPVFKRRRSGRSRASACRHRGPRARAGRRDEDQPGHPARPARRERRRRGRRSTSCINERVELNAMASDALIEMIETQAQGLRPRKGGPGRRTLLAETYRAFHRSQQLRERFEEMEEEFDEEADDIEIPRGLKKRVRAVLAKHDDLRWDDAVQVVLDEQRSIACERRRKRPKRSPATSPAATKTTNRIARGERQRYAGTVRCASSCRARRREDCPFEADAGRGLSAL